MSRKGRAIETESKLVSPGLKEYKGWREDDYYGYSMLFREQKCELVAHVYNPS
jgi:hypothetical protein